MPYVFPDFGRYPNDGFNLVDTNGSNDSVPLTELNKTVCPDGVQWIHTIFGQCVLSDRQYASVICGLGSTFISTINGIPQVYMNCAKGIPDKALSIFLILQWMAGDGLNLIGCFLTGQLPVQIVYAIFMVSLDIIMLIQYTYFKIKHSYEDRVARDLAVNDASINVPAGDLKRATVYCVTAIWGLSFLGYGFMPGEQSLRIKRNPAGRSLLVSSPSQGPFFTGVLDEVGFGIGCVSTCFYIASRAPQIYTNWKRKSTEGVSLWLFLLLIISNILYGSSILIHSSELYHVLHSLPWIIGALGMVTFDTLIMFQFWIYRHNSDRTLIINEDDETSPLLNSEISVPQSSYSGNFQDSNRS